MIFVVDSVSDPAYDIAASLAKTAKGSLVKVIVAGQALTTSQKIQNLCTGIQVGL